MGDPCHLPFISAPCRFVDTQRRKLVDVLLVADFLLRLHGLFRRSFGWRRDRDSDHPSATTAPQDIETGHGPRLNENAGGDVDVPGGQEGPHPSAGLDDVLDVSTCPSPYLPQLYSSGPQLYSKGLGDLLYLRVT